MRDQTESGAEGLGLLRGGVVEELVFGTRDLSKIDSLIGHFCLSTLGSEVAEVLFRTTSVGVVFGLLLSDGRRIVVKAHQPRETQARLEAVSAIQSELYRAGLPCPEPLAGPVVLVNGHATAEALLDDGEYRDTHDPRCRQLIAQALARHLEITGRRPAPEALMGTWSLFDDDRLWPEQAHSPIFDFGATDAGAEWIDALGEEAKAAIDQSGLPMAGHCDWSGKHFRFAQDRITAIYDWDSLGVCPETVIVGVAAVTYTARFDLPGVSRAPTPEEMRAFIDEYSAARHTRLTRRERSHIAAYGLFVAAYTARCEHCALDGYDAEADPASFTTTLRAHGSSYLTV